MHNDDYGRGYNAGYDRAKGEMKYYREQGYREGFIEGQRLANEFLLTQAQLAVKPIIVYCIKDQLIKDGRCTFDE